MEGLDNMPGVESTEFPFEPLSNFIVIEIEEPQERTTVGGVIIPANVEQKTLKSKVIAISREKEKDGAYMVRTVKVGDSVVFDVRGGQLIDVAGKDYLVIRETELFGILKGDGGSILQFQKGKSQKSRIQTFS